MLHMLLQLLPTSMYLLSLSLIVVLFLPRTRLTGVSDDLGEGLESREGHQVRKLHHRSRVHVSCCGGVLQV